MFVANTVDADAKIGGSVVDRVSPRELWGRQGLHFPFKECCAVGVLCRGFRARCLTLWNILCVLRVTNVYIIRSLSMLTGVFIDGGVMVKVQHVRGSGAGTLEIALEGDHIVNRRVTRGGQPHRSENNSNTHRSAYGLLALRVLI